MTTMTKKMRGRYREAALGPIPDDWGVSNLEKVTDCLDHLRVPLNESQRSKRRGDIPYCGANGVLDYIDDYVVDDDIILIAEDGGYFDEYRTRPIAYRMRGKCWVNNHAHILKAKRGTDQEFLFYSLVHKNLLPFIASGTRAKLNKFEMYRVQIAIPRNEEEQAAIGDVLADMDGLISALDGLIAKKHEIKTATMQEVLTGKKRLTGWASKPGYKQTEVGMIPRDWDLAALGSLVDQTRNIRYGIVQPGTYDANGRYMIRGQDYSEVNGWARPDELFRVRPQIEERYRKARVRAGDLIMTIVGYCGHVEVVPDWLDGANITQTTARIAIDPAKAVSTYCKYALQGSMGKSQVALYLKGAAQPGLNIRDVEVFRVALPPTRTEQEAIAAVLSGMDAEIAALEARRRKTVTLKEGVMQQLLTGKIRLV